MDLYLIQVSPQWFGELQKHKEIWKIHVSSTFIYSYYGFVRLSKEPPVAGNTFVSCKLSLNL